MQGCTIYGKIRFLWICNTCFSLRNKKLFMDESTDFVLLDSATTPTTLNFLDSQCLARAEWTFFRLLPPVRSASEISGFFGIPIGQPWIWEDGSRDMTMIMWEIGYRQKTKRYGPVQEQMETEQRLLKADNSSLMMMWRLSPVVRKPTHLNAKFEVVC